MKLPIIIIGAGGHAAVVADALLAAGELVIGFADVDPAMQGKLICGVPILGGDGILDGYSPASVNLANGIGTIGSVRARMEIQRRLKSSGWRFVSVRHPTAIVSPFASVANGVHLLAASVLQAGVVVGEGCIVNTAAVLEHDVHLGEWVHVAPRALLCGAVVVGARCHVGAGAIVKQGLRLGNDTVVGAGAVVIKDFCGDGVLIGVPARKMECRV